MADWINGTKGNGKSILKGYRVSLGGLCGYEAIHH